MLSPILGPQVHEARGFQDRSRILVHMRIPAPGFSPFRPDHALSQITGSSQSCTMFLTIQTQVFNSIVRLLGLRGVYFVCKAALFSGGTLRKTQTLLQGLLAAARISSHEIGAQHPKPRPLTPKTPKPARPLNPEPLNRFMLGGPLVLNLLVGGGS